MSQISSVTNSQIEKNILDIMNSTISQIEKNILAISNSVKTYTGSNIIKQTIADMLDTFTGSKAECPLLHFMSYFDNSINQLTILDYVNALRSKISSGVYSPTITTA